MSAKSSARLELFCPWLSMNNVEMRLKSKERHIQTNSSPLRTWSSERRLICRSLTSLSAKRICHSCWNTSMRQFGTVACIRFTVRMLSTTPIIRKLVWFWRKYTLQRAELCSNCTGRLRMWPNRGKMGTQHLRNCSRSKEMIWSIALVVIHQPSSSSSKARRRKHCTHLIKTKLWALFHSNKFGMARSQTTKSWSLLQLGSLPNGTSQIWALQEMEHSSTSWKTDTLPKRLSWQHRTTCVTACVLSFTSWR